MVLPAHGGQPGRIAASFGMEVKGKVYDFSANINPNGPPSWLSEQLPRLMEEVAYYPDPDYLEAYEALAKHEGMDPEQLLLTNGGAEAIFLITQLFLGKKALTINPTFTEYERACQAFNIGLTHLRLNQEFRFPVEAMAQVMPDVDVVFLCYPNNPTGTILPLTELEHLLKLGMEIGTTFVIDEAFVHFLFEEELSVKQLLAFYPNLIILRSLTKIFAIPGLRAGYMMASKDYIQKLKEKQPSWSVNGITANILPVLLSDKSYMAATKAWLEKECKKLAENLSALKFIHTVSSVNFYLLKDGERPDETEELFRFLVENHIIPRHTDNFKGLDGSYLRLAVRSAEENDYLLYVLRKWREAP
ncbi:threonine-phosphate decarboxylase CobD [Thalassobacillus devorans]|uniref:threonine-phosphate decarboxylase CobD n=1 Tax=Thalassobacillus devorans TaxID=279813 RepID=UPI00048D27CB|nr:threonine-phosphate decarboxylase CobD [Thalassobacillus devorans]